MAESPEESFHVFLSSLIAQAANVDATHCDQLVETDEDQRKRGLFFLCALLVLSFNTFTLAPRSGKDRTPPKLGRNDNRVTLSAHAYINFDLFIVLPQLLTVCSLISVFCSVADSYNTRQKGVD